METITQPILVIQADPIEIWRFETDTSLHLALSAQAHGFRVFVTSPTSLARDNEAVWVVGDWVSFYDVKKGFFKRHGSERLNLAHAHTIVIRQNPPVDMAYMTTCLLLSQLPESVRIINNPTSLCLYAEKITPFLFPDLIPPTLISWSEVEIQIFLDQYPTCILKPLYSFGGRDVIRINRDQVRIPELLDHWRKVHHTPPLIQTFLPDIYQGDKRVLFLNGDVIAVIKRIPAPDSYLSNLAAGGRAELCELTSQETLITERISKFLREKNIVMAGVDIISDKLIEMNITSPTGFRLASTFLNQPTLDVLWS